VPALVFRIIGVKPIEGATELTIDLGGNTSISRSWRAAIVDDDGRAVEHGQLVIVGLVGGGANHLCIATVKIPANVVADKYRRVRFDP